MHSTNRVLSLSIAVVAIGSLQACITNPLNGQQQSGPTNTSVTLAGNVPSASLPVTMEFLTNASSDPSIHTNWTTLPTVNASASSTQSWDGQNFFSWSTSFTPSSTAWPQGGLLRVRGKTHYGSQDYALQVYDEDFDSCALNNQSTSYFSLPGACGSPYVYPTDSDPSNAPWAGATTNYVAALVSTTPNGSGGLQAPPEFLGIKAPPGLLKGTAQQNDTNAYYGYINAPLNFASWYSTYFATATGAASAIYYNNNDLGFGREMHCAATTTPAGGKACYVRNYGNTAGVGAFPASSTSALALAETHAGYFATVAMVYDPTNGADAPNAMTFYVYKAPDPITGVEALQPFARLDSVDVVEHVPGNCLSCHGGSSSYSNTGGVYTVTKGRFVAFDPYNFLYDSTSTLAGQQESFRKLNAHVNDTWASGSAIQTFLTNMYSPNGVYSTGQTANNTYVPTGWQDSGTNGPHQKLYNEVVKPYCRTCHMTHDAGMTWMSFSELESDGTVGFYACSPSSGSLSMPHAERTAEQFWGSQARAHLVAGLQLDSACKMPHQYQ